MFLLKTTTKFEKQVNKLPQLIKKALPKKLRLLEKNPKHPSLRTKQNYTASKEAKTKILESSITDTYRILWKYDEGKVILLLVIGDHKIVE